MKTIKNSSSVIRGLPPECLMKMPSFMMYKISQYFKEEADTLFADTPTDARGFSVLHALIFTGPMTQQNLCEGLWIDRGTMVGVINQLENAGLVLRKKNPRDARSYIVSATKTGRDFHKSRIKKFQYLECRLFPSMTPSEWQELSRLLNKLMQISQVQEVQAV